MAWVAGVGEAQEDVGGGVSPAGDGEALEIAFAPDFDEGFNGGALAAGGLFIDGPFLLAGFGDDHGGEVVVVTGDAAGFAEEGDVVFLEQREGAGEGGAAIGGGLDAAGGGWRGLGWRGAGGLQEADDFGVALAVGEVGDGGAEGGFGGGFGAFIEEGFYDGRVGDFEAGGNHESGCLERRFGGVGIGTAVEEEFCVGGVALADGGEECVVEHGLGGGGEEGIDAGLAGVGIDGGGKIGREGFGVVAVFEEELEDGFVAGSGGCGFCAGGEQEF
jgi:hypothetical protein